MIICSVQHTGTHLIAKKFEGYKWIAFNEDDERPHIHVGHISNGLYPGILNLIQSEPAIIPVRHPYLVEESWRRRDMPISVLINNYKLLVELDKFNPYYVAIDTPLRDSQIDAINKELDLNLSKEWPILNSKHNTHGLKREDCQPTPEIQELVNDIQPFLSRFY